MKTLITIGVVVAIVLLIVFGIPGLLSHVRIWKQEVGTKIDQAQTTAHEEERVRNEKLREIESLDKEYGETADIDTQIMELQKENERLIDRRAKDIKYMKKGNEVLASCSPSQGKIPIGDKLFDRKIVKKNLDARLKRCKNIDKALAKNEKMLEQQLALRNRLQEDYEEVRGLLLADLDEIDKDSVEMAQLEVEERMLEKMREFSNKKFSRPKTDSSRAYQSWKRRLAEKRKRVRTLRAVPPITTSGSEDKEIEEAFEEEFSGDLTARIENYLSRDKKAESFSTELEKALDEVPAMTN